MDAEEVESWYQDRKEALTLRMEAQLMEGASYEKAREAFDTDFNKLIAQMRSKQLKITKEDAEKDKDKVIEDFVTEKIENMKEEVTIWLEQKRGPKPKKQTK
ncbi:MAG: hypothetical protein ABIA93_03895 [Candidatus Woesearchaeota archaeon]